MKRGWKEFIRRSSISYDAFIAAWKASRKGRGVHYHIVGFTSKREYQIIFSELHSAHVRYHRRIKAINYANVAIRDKKGRFSK